MLQFGVDPGPRVAKILGLLKRGGVADIWGVTPPVFAPLNWSPTQPPPHHSTTGVFGSVLHMKSEASLKQTKIADFLWKTVKHFDSGPFFGGSVMSLQALSL